MKRKMQMWKIVAAVGVVLCMVSSRALAVSDDEFVGPFTNWVNIKTAYGAVGNGTNDDTAAFQNAFNDIGTTGHGHILWVPAGTYKITQQILLYSRLNISIIGEDPATTIIQWRGTNIVFSPGSTACSMFFFDSVAYSRFDRLTFDGSGSQMVLIDQSWDKSSNYFDTGNEYADDNFQNAYIGIRGGILDGGFAETSVLRCHFTNLQTAGIITENFNALDLWVHDSVFDHDGVGVGDCAWEPDGTYVTGAGDFRVYNSIFRYSRNGDLAIGNTSVFSFRNNYSIGSYQFICCGGGNNNPANITMQGNTILDTTNSQSVSIGTFGPLVMCDNVIRSLNGATAPVVSIGGFSQYANSVAVGNTFTVSNAISVYGRLDEIDSSIVSASTINASEPVLPGTEPNLHRPVIELPAGATTAQIQQAITNAVAQYTGQRPVVHFPEGSYNISSTIVIPSNADVQLVGDGWLITCLQWNGGGGGPAMQIQGPSHATLRELQINGNQQVDTLVATNIDQQGSRFFMSCAYATSGKNSSIFYDGLDYAAVAIEDGGCSGERGGVDIRVVGGPLAAAGNPQGGKVALYSGGGGGDEYYTNNIDVSNGGTLLVRDYWFDAEPPAPYRAYAHITQGTVTFDSAHINMRETEYPATPPTFDLSNLVGKVSLLGTDFGNAIVISGDGSNAQVAGIGVIRSQPAPADPFFLNNASPPATAGLVESCQWSPNLAMGATVPTANAGAINNAFIKNMLAQARAEQTPQLTDLPANVSDIRLFRVNACLGINSLHLVRGGEPAAPSPDTTPPSTPTNLSGVAIAETKINLAWSSSTDNVGVVNYRVFRNGVQAGMAFTNAYTDTGLAPGTIYTYTVKAADAAGNFSPASNAIGVTTPSHQTPVLAAWYKFDEGSGTTAADSSGNSLTATLNDSSMWSTNTPHASGYSMQFTTENQSLTTATSSILDTDTHTISFWLKINDTSSGWYQILDFRPAGSDRSPGIWTNPEANGLCLHWRYDPANTGIFSAGPSGEGSFFDVGTWYQITGVKDKDMFTLYVNGVCVETVNVANPKAAGSASVEMGHGASAAAPVSLDDVRIFANALSASEVAALYAPSNTPASASATGGYTVTNYVENNTNFTAYIFTNPAEAGAFTISGGALTCDLLVVGGGAGGAMAGGGAGGYVFSNQMSVAAGTYTVTIGAGGAYTSNNSNPGNNGTNSVFGSIIAYGGGGGAGLSANNAQGGASGGGATSGTRTGGTNLFGAQGYPGGNTSASGNAQAGGGGAGGNGGTPPSSSQSGNGGAGITNTMSGVATGYAGGGGGGFYYAGTTLGTVSCGGGAGGNAAAGGNATVNTGGGGCGGNVRGGNGGSGIVIVRFSGANNLLFFGSVKNTGGGWGLDFMTASGVSYEMMWRTNLLSGGWLLYTNLFGDGNDAHVVFTNAVPQAFFQIQVAP